MALTGYGISAVEIATLLEVDRKTLAKHYRRELDIGATEANARVAQALYTNATRHNSVAAQIWWTKARMKWKDTSEVAIGGNGQSVIYEVRLGDAPAAPALSAPELTIDADQDDGALTVTIDGDADA